MHGRLQVQNEVEASAALGTWAAQAGCIASKLRSCPRRKDARARGDLGWAVGAVLKHASSRTITLITLERILQIIVSAAAIITAASVSNNLFGLPVVGF